MKYLLFYPLKCVDCKICELVCSFENTGGFNPRYSLIKISINPETGINTVSLSKRCTLCSSCEKNCPTHALQFSSHLEEIREEIEIRILVGQVSKII
jgi:carbon-monoxide dehydrogenase iron sulfur subunit